MFKLEINPALLPRTMTRREWKKIWRWRRICEKRLKAKMGLSDGNIR